MKIAVIAVGYNRPDSMHRLLNSILEASYGTDEVDLIISIDKGQRQNEIIDIANTVDWKQGKKIIRAFETRQGLRPHILQCGSYTDEYDAVIVLEDDLIVAEGYYSYVRQTVDFYADNSDIAGISLYKHIINQGSNRVFEPKKNEYDVYLMQVAQSWGQCWTKNMWQKFIAWYNENNGELVANHKLPSYIASWNKQSWLKYYNSYVSEKGLFFVYPYTSLTTNHTEAGEHAKFLCHDYQVPLQEGVMEYRLPTVENAIKYDLFFERLGIEDSIIPDVKGKKLLDLMGVRKNFGDSDVLISIQRLPYKLLKEFGLKYRPIEENILKSVVGKGIYVYDLHTKSVKPTHKNNYQIVRFDVRAIHWKSTLLHGVIGFFDAIKRHLTK